ncbi:ABC transporter permease [Streptomyces radicis]|uniref:Transport permease protein n=1 Tax=Streptomyces radicis TaxID=1750517 RepID=A0A3A9WDH2_9ACTN|nr:ABC transporter permease [Streptomyces radicis]RKN05706.1 ABC transporter permease [Streptomyces radicis]RKN17546.1 ABC transporter permease [Streptomyces radicis]
MTATTVVLRTEARLFAREPGALFWIVAFPALLLTALGLVPAFREVDEELDGLRVVDLYVPIAVLLAMIMAGVQSMPVVLSGYRERGILRRLSATPARPSSLLAAQLAVHGGAVLVAVALTLAVGWLAFDVEPAGQPVGYGLAVLLAAFTSLALGGMIAALTPSAKAAQTLGLVIFFPAMFSAGVYVPVSTMPGLLGDVVELTPFGASAAALDRAAAGNWPHGLDVAVTGVWGLLFLGVAARWFRWE